MLFKFVPLDKVSLIYSNYKWSKIWLYASYFVYCALSMSKDSDKWINVVSEITCIYINCYVPNSIGKKINLYRYNH